MNRESMNSSSSRPMKLRRRPDLICERQTYQGREYWIVKDPIALKYFRFEEEEFQLLQLLNGRASADDIQFEFNRRFAPQKISMGELFQFTGMLYRNSLVLSDAAHQGRELSSREDKNRRRTRRASLLNILAFQFRGFDPDRLLTWLNRKIGWFFSASMVIVGTALFASAAALLLTHWDELRQRLPAFHEFFHSANWLGLGLTLALTKVLHEMGHGISCKRFGGQCHEMGFMLLVMTPCLYVNVSDSWILPSKWKRIAVAAAGMYVELWIACAAVFCWWFTQPGLVNQLALNAIFVCSVSTLLFNANPLMKYDGYFIVSDLLEIPNLRQKSAALLQRMFGYWALGLESPRDPFLPQRHRWLFAGYAVCAIAYRWLITISIFFFLYNVLEPHGLKVVGQILALIALVGIISSPLVQVFQFVSVPGRVNQVSRPRAITTIVLATSLIGALLLVRLPHHVWCDLYIQPRDAAAIYAKAPGRLKRILVEPNQTVRTGDPIIELENVALEADVADLVGQRNVAEVRWHSAAHISNYDPKYSGDVDTANASFVSLSNLAEQRRKDLDNLVIRAPISGMLLPGDTILETPSEDGKLSRWSGRVLEPRNLGAMILEGTSIGQIAPDASQLEAILAIDQSDIEFVGPNQHVEIWIRQAPGNTFESRTHQVSLTEMKTVPKCLSAKFGGGLATTTGSDESERPTSTTYRVDVPFDDANQSIVAGSSGRARILVGYRSVGQRLWRLICKTVRFDL